MARLRLKASVEISWLHNPTIGTYIPFVLGIGAIFRRWIQSSKDSFLPGRSLNSKVIRLVDLGAIANPCRLREYEAEGDLPRMVSWSSYEEVT